MDSQIFLLKIQFQAAPELHSWGLVGWPGDGWQLLVCQSADQLWPRLQLSLHVVRLPVQLQRPGARSQLRGRSWPEADLQLQHRPRSAQSIARAGRPPRWCWCRDHGLPCQPHGLDSKYIIFISTLWFLFAISFEHDKTSLKIRWCHQR